MLAGKNICRRMTYVIHLIFLLSLFQAIPGFDLFKHDSFAEKSLRILTIQIPAISAKQNFPPVQLRLIQDLLQHEV